MRAIGIDVGGTFTDFVYFDHDSGRIEVMKVSSGGDLAATVAEGSAGPPQRTRSR